MNARTAVVTGGASGIGAATIALFVERGWNAVVVDRSVEESPTAAPPRDAAVKVVRIRADVTDEADLSRVGDLVAHEFGSVDAVVTCAGTADNSPLREVDAARFRRTLDVNLVSTFLTVQTFAEPLRAARGAVVTVASVSGLRGSPNRAAYAASKGGVIALTRQLAVELASEDVRVNCVAPGSTMTPLAASRQGGPEVQRAIRRAIPLGRYAQPTEIAEAICFLASPDASFITGQVLGADGGQLASAGWSIERTAHVG